eukprot:scaffold11463_cov124-Isochrysis_galbana.AAC.13
MPGTLKGDEGGSAVGGAVGQGDGNGAVALPLGEVALVEGQAVSAVETEGGSRRGVEGGDAGVEGPPPHRPAVREVEVGEEQMGKWKKRGGPELEAAIASGAVALLSARWVVALAEREGGVLQPRQALPDEAFLSLSQVQKATKGNYELPVVCISQSWLQPDHPAGWSQLNWRKARGGGRPFRVPHCMPTYLWALTLLPVAFSYTSTHSRAMRNSS